MKDESYQVYDWCADHVRIAGDKTESSVVVFEGIDWVDSNMTLCPFCGARMRSDFVGEEGFILACEHECSGWLKEREKIHKINELKKQIKDIQDDIKKNALENGIRTFAKEYASHQGERDAFDEEVAQYAK